VDDIGNRHAAQPLAKREGLPPAKVVEAGIVGLFARLRLRMPNYVKHRKGH
jgi:hypothetical protein